MGTHNVPFIFRGYNLPIFLGQKNFHIFPWVLGVQRYGLFDYIWVRKGWSKREFSAINSEGQSSKSMKQPPRLPMNPMNI